jgi:hypothetical protein
MAESMSSAQDLEVIYKQSQLERSYECLQPATSVGLYAAMDKLALFWE